MTAVSRRNFLKGAAALGAATALGTAFGCSDQNAVELGETGKTVEERVGFCCQCTYRPCSFKAKVEDGVLMEIEGHSERTANLGTLCPRPNVYPMYQYNPYRIKAPMKRTNPEKGLDIDPGWVEISWDEALDLAASKMKEVRDRNPLELVHLYGFADRDATESGFAGIGGFAPAFGTKTINSSKGQFCALHYFGSMVWADMAALKPDYYYSDYIIFVGRAPGMSSAMAEGTARGAAHFLRKGGKMIVVDPYCPIEGSLGEWIPIKPSTEMSFGYALNHVLLYENKGYDVESLKTRTDSPFLIGPDKEYYRGPSGKIQVWDNAAGAPKDYNDPSLGDVALEGTFNVDGVEMSTVFTHYKNCFKDFTPEWAEKICTIPAATIRRLVDELVEHAKIGSTITIDGEELPYRPAQIITCRGVSNHEDGVLAEASIKNINLLLGNQYVPGGSNVAKGGKLNLDDDEIIKPYFEATPCEEVTWPPEAFDLVDVFPHRHSTDSLMWQVISEGPEKWGFEIKPRVLFSVSSNSVVATCNPDTVVDALKKFEYIIYSCCYHMDETAMMSDLLLPSHSRIEGSGIGKNVSTNCFSSAEESYLRDSGAYVYRNLIDPLYNTMRGNDITIELADRIGMNEEFNKEVSKLGVFGKKLVDTEYELTGDTKYTCEEIWDRFLKNTFGPENGLDKLMEVEIMPDPLPDTKSAFRYYATPNARFAFWLQSQKHSGEVLLSRLDEIGLGEDFFHYPMDYLRRRYEPMPYFYPTTERKLHNAPEEYDMWTFTYRLPQFLFRFGGQDQNVWSREWSQMYDPEFACIIMNPATARAKGLESGDVVILESYNAGKTKGKLYLTERVHPEAIGFGGAIGRKTKAMGEELTNDPLYAELINGHMGYLEPIHGGTEVTARVKVYKA